MSDKEVIEEFKEKCPTILKILEKEIRADERRKFAEWLKRKSVYIQYDYEDFRPYYYYSTVDEVLGEYEKEQE